MMKLINGKVEEFINPSNYCNGNTIDKEENVMEALNIMNKNKITALFVTDINSKVPKGIIHIHDCLRITT